MRPPPTAPPFRLRPLRVVVVWPHVIEEVTPHEYFYTRFYRCDDGGVGDMPTKDNQDGPGEASTPASVPPQPQPPPPGPATPAPADTASADGNGQAAGDAPEPAAKQKAQRLSAREVQKEVQDIRSEMVAFRVGVENQLAGLRSDMDRVLQRLSTLPA